MTDLNIHILLELQNYQSSAHFVIPFWPTRVAMTTKAVITNLQRLVRCGHTTAKSAF